MPQSPTQSVNALQSECKAESIHFPLVGGANSKDDTDKYKRIARDSQKAKAGKRLTLL